MEAERVDDEHVEHQTGDDRGNARERPRAPRPARQRNRTTL